VVDWPDLKRVAVLLYPGVGLLEVAGPLAALGSLKNVFEPLLLAPEAGPVETSQGPQLVAETSYEDAPPTEWLLVPGGTGLRARVEDKPGLAWLAERVKASERVLAVGTGSAWLAAAGVLDGRQATTATRALAWAKELRPAVRWQAGARWVVDGPFVTAAGPAAGLDMALAELTAVTAPDVGANVARALEHDWCADSRRDPFASGTWQPRT